MLFANRKNGKTKTRAKHIRRKRSMTDSPLGISLLGSTLSLALCTLLFVGTSFAWYTGVAKAPAQNLTAGNMSLVLGNYDSAGKWVTYDTSSSSPTSLTWTMAAKGNHLSNAAVWEPEDVGSLTPFRVMNTGTIGLRYKVCISGLGADTNPAMLDDLQFYVKTSYTENGTEKFKLTPVDPYTLAYAANAGLSYVEKATEKLQGNAAGAVSDEITLVAYMNPEAELPVSGNKVQLSVAAYAVQSINTEEAVPGDTLYVKTCQELLDAVKAANASASPMTIRLGADIELEMDTVAQQLIFTGIADANGNVIPKWTVLDLYGHTISGSFKDTTGENADSGLIQVSENAILAITDNGPTQSDHTTGKICVTDKNGNGNYALFSIAETGRLVITGGEYTFSKTSVSDTDTAAKYTSGIVFCKETNPSVTISKGTFSFDVSDFVKFSGTAELSSIVDSGNSTTEVSIKKYSNGKYYEVNAAGRWVKSKDSNTVLDNPQAEGNSPYDFSRCVVDYSGTVTNTVGNKIK